MTTGSVDSGGTAAAQSGSLPCAIWLVLSVFLVDLAVTLTAGTDMFNPTLLLPTRRAKSRPCRCDCLTSRPWARPLPSS